MKSIYLRVNTYREQGEQSLANCLSESWYGSLVSAGVSSASGLRVCANFQVRMAIVTVPSEVAGVGLIALILVHELRLAIKS